VSGYYSLLSGSVACDSNYNCGTYSQVLSYCLGNFRGFFSLLRI